LLSHLRTGEIKTWRVWELALFFEFPAMTSEIEPTQSGASAYKLAMGTLLMNGKTIGESEKV